MKRGMTFGCRAVLMGAVAFGALTLDVDGKERRRPKKATASAPGTAGWRAFRDPETGALREPTAEEARALARDAASKSSAPVEFEVVVHPNGMKSVDLKGAFAMHLVARRNADGSISYACRHDHQSRKEK